MYSYEDRIRAVQLYIKLGKRTGATIRQLGYPTKNALKGWHREYDHGGDLRVGVVRSKSKYSGEQKKVAVGHYLNHGRCLVGTRNALGYPCRETLAVWVDELHPKLRTRVVGRVVGVLHPQEAMQAAVIELCTRQVSLRKHPSLPTTSNQTTTCLMPRFLAHFTLTSVMAIGCQITGIDSRWPSCILRSKNCAPNCANSAMRTKPHVCMQRHASFHSSVVYH